MSPRQSTYVAFLRGINVRGNTLKMDALREICAELGAQNARTYLQSGNVIFHAVGSADRWTQTLERALIGKTRLPISVIVRTGSELATIAASNPFLKERGIDVALLAVTFLQQALAKDALAALHGLDIGSERFHCAGREIYIHCPRGFADAKLYLLDKVLAQRTTVRNWNTVTKLRALSAE
jgi:uncharacterized protein (DUF1697 family)